MARKRKSNVDEVVTPDKRACVEDDDTGDASVHSSDFDGEVDRILKRSCARDVQSNKGNGVSVDADVPPPSRLPLKIGCRKFNIQNRFKGKLQAKTSYEVIKNIKSKLTDSQLDLFRRSPFGEFLFVPEYKNQMQVLNAVLLHEIHDTDPNSMRFLFGSDKVRFSIVEYALNTGLKCYGDDTVSNFVDIDSSCNRLGNLYFRGSKNYINRDLM